MTPWPRDPHRPGAPGEPGAHTRPARGAACAPEADDPFAAEAVADLAARLKAAGLRPRFEYTTGEAARILGVSRETVRQMTLRWEPPQVPNRHPTGLFALKLGRHRRIPHRALADWLRRNTAYAREVE